MRDLAMLFVSFPELKSESGAVNDALKRIGVSGEELDTWRELVSKEIEAPQRRSRIRLNETLAEDSRHTYNHAL